MSNVRAVATLGVIALMAQLALVACDEEEAPAANDATRNASATQAPQGEHAGTSDHGANDAGAEVCGDDACAEAQADAGARGAADQDDADQEKLPSTPADLVADSDASAAVLDASIAVGPGAEADSATVDAADDDASPSARCDAAPDGCGDGCQGTACDPDAPFALCPGDSTDSSLSCALGEETEFSYGDIIAQPITPSGDVRLLSFGARTGPHSGACNAYLSLHTDLDGEPGAIVNATPYRGLSKDAANLTPPVSAIDSKVMLSAGTRYWLVARLGGAMGERCRFFVADGSGSAQPYRMQATDSVEAPDDMLPGQTQRGPGGAVSLFIEAQRL